MPEAAPDAPQGVRRFLGFTWSHAGPLVALVASAAALTFNLVPACSPDPGVALGATVSVQSVDQGVSYYTYLAAFDPKTLTAAKPADRQTFHTQPGVVVYLRTKVQGKKHGHVRLDYVNYGWTSKKALDAPTAALGFKEDTTSDEWVVPVFVYPPQTPPEDYFVRVRIFDGSVLLAYADTGRLTAVPLS